MTLKGLYPVGVFIVLLLTSPSNSAEQPDQRPTLSLEQVERLQFGRVSTDVRRGGSVVIDAATGRKTLHGGAVDLGGFHGRAEFLVKGEPGASFIVTIPRELSLKASKTGTTAILTQFRSSPSGVGILNNTGRATIYVGATLQLRSGQLGGDYAGSVTLFVDYQ